ncbi:hypothetical protein [Streptomyces caniscabiei]|uniref:hypothetical protein n=1 Tax=Streptomyces caniscabiei TaxID=2746961 RepID=UPI001180D4C7|nr:hypothetical protein [Streptomyces caniscabiei]
MGEAAREGRPACDADVRLLDVGQSAGFGGDGVAARAITQVDAFLRRCAADGHRAGVTRTPLGEQPPQGEQGDESKSGDDYGPPPPAPAAPAGPVGGAEQDVVRGGQGQGPVGGRHQVVSPVEAEPGGHDQQAAAEQYQSG